jgi:hypothetical protein
MSSATFTVHAEQSRWQSHLQICECGRLAVGVALELMHGLRAQSESGLGRSPGPTPTPRRHAVTLESRGL